ncbi:unnamed protein product, partial [Brassica rapa subsp. trilocularis]
LIAVSSFGDREKGRFEGDLAVASVVLAGNTPPVFFFFLIEVSETSSHFATRS